MSVANEPEMTKGNLSAPPTNRQPSNGPAKPEVPANPAVARFRKGFYSDSQYGLLMAMGEEPTEYQRMMESLLEDLQPGEGFEAELVEQMGQTFWRMRRVQRMHDGLALRRIQGKLESEETLAAIKASQAFALLQPFEDLQKALSPRRQGPTAEEVEAFVKSRQHDSSPEMQEFIRLLQSLPGPMDERERREARHRARTELGRLMEGYATLTWLSARRSEKVRSPENLAALMAPGGQDGVMLQKMEDSHLRRLWRLTNTLAKVRKGAFHKKKMLKNDERSRNVYENKQNSDNMPDAKSDICVDTR